MKSEERAVPSGTPVRRVEQPRQALMAVMLDRVPQSKALVMKAVSNDAVAHDAGHIRDTPDQHRLDADPAADPAGIGRTAVAESVTLASAESLTSTVLRQRCPQGLWEPDPSSTMVDEDLDSTVSLEELRGLRSQLYEVRRKQPLRRLLISSALSGEGKTFVTANLARTMAQRPSDSVLVVDGDLRLSRLHRPLGASAGPGLSEYLQGEADLFSIIQRGPIDNLFFVAGGTPKENAADLIGNGRLEILLQRLAPAFDWMILDSPPTLLVTDASLLASLCDGVLFVIRAGVTTVDMARKALQMFRGKPLLGTVLNGSPLRTPYADYYHRCEPGRKGKGKSK